MMVLLKHEMEMFPKKEKTTGLYCRGRNLAKSWKCFQSEKMYD